VGRVVIRGAGGIGGALGAWPTRSGLEVRPMDRDRGRVRAVRSQRPPVTGARGSSQVEARAVLPEEAKGPPGTAVTKRRWAGARSKPGRASPRFATAPVDVSVHETPRRPGAGWARYRRVREAMGVPEPPGVHTEDLGGVRPHDHREPAVEAMARFSRGRIEVGAGVRRTPVVRRRRSEVGRRAGTPRREGTRPGLDPALDRRRPGPIHELEEARRMSWDDLTEPAAAGRAAGEPR